MAKRVLLGLAATVALIVLVLGALVAYAARDRKDTFALADAEFADVGYLQRLASQDDALSGRDGNFSVYAHRLKSGTGTVFGFRAYSPGRLAAIDDETYRKITLWIAGAIPTTAIEVPFGDDSRARLVVSDGGSAWPRLGCSRVATAGIVRVQRTNGRFRITIRADTIAAGKITPVECDTEAVGLTFEAPEIVFDDLTPWLGLEGRHPYEETYMPIWPNHALRVTASRRTAQLSHD